MLQCSKELLEKSSILVVFIEEYKVMEVTWNQINYIYIFIVPASVKKKNVLSSLHQNDQNIICESSILAD